MLENLKNYGEYVDLIKTGYYHINTFDINDNNIDTHFMSILNIFRDGIELEEVQQMFINITFVDNVTIDLSIFDYFYNLIFWKLTTALNEDITSDRLFFVIDIKRSEIAKYINNVLIKRHRTDVSFKKLNNIIDDCLDKLKYINEFSLYFMNSLCLEDTIDLVKEFPEFANSINMDFSNLPLEDVKRIGLDIAEMQIDIIKNSDHCLRDAFRTGEGINYKQYKEVAVNIGTKPDGQGNIFNYIINKSFMNGGVNDHISYTIDMNNSRIAQILSKENVGISGAFARILELNNIDTRLHKDPNYVCMTKNFIKVYINNDLKLKKYNLRYYKTNPKGKDYLLNYDTDKHLIGQTLYFRSPITCASKAKGQGICYRCYGQLAYVNNTINIGKIAAELLSAVLTQMLLSAKHLLESTVIALKWNSEFENFFEVNLNTIALAQYTEDMDGCKLIIDKDKIDDDEDDEDSTRYSEYITEFIILQKTGEEIIFSAYNGVADENLYISQELNTFIHAKYPNLNNVKEIVLNLEELKDLSCLFILQIKNQELSYTLDRAKAIIDRKSITPLYTKDEIVNDFINTLEKGNININAVHMEVLISNQIRTTDDILDYPDWEIEDIPYQILTLRSSIKNNPSITVSLEYQGVSKIIIDPLSSRKHKPSYYDLYFMEQPQEYINNDKLVSDSFVPLSDRDDVIKTPIKFLDED